MWRHDWLALALQFGCQRTFSTYYEGKRYDKTNCKPANVWEKGEKVALTKSIRTGVCFVFVVGSLLAFEVRFGFAQTPSFTPATNFLAGSVPYSVAVADFNKDGIPDLAVVNQNSNNVSILLGTGTGSFGAATNFAVGSLPHFVAVGDFNGDGKQDLAVANFNDNDVSILLGTGTGSFGVATNFAAGTGPHFIAVDDFNGDGKQDLAVANYGSNNVSVLLGTGTGSFGASTNYAVGNNPLSVTVGDFNGDAKQDLVVANYNSNDVPEQLPHAGDGCDRERRDHADGLAADGGGA